VRAKTGIRSGGAELEKQQWQPFSSGGGGGLMSQSTVTERASGLFWQKKKKIGEK
jgi:hypothetical protein